MSDRTPPEQIAAVPGDALPRVALVGRTNVGKSTLFNRVAGGRRALVAPTPGLTRDRREAKVDKGGAPFVLVDTGGLELGSDAAFTAEIAEQVETAVAGAAVIWFVLDGGEGLTPLDEDLHRWLLRRGKPLLTLVNKIDNHRRREDMPEFYALGVDSLYAVSSMHGTGIDALLEATSAVLPVEATAEGTAPADVRALPIRVALIGKPNVGKSSLVNAILGQERMIVSEQAGTTREPVDVPLRWEGRDFTLIDTAGIRRRAKTYESLDKISALTSIGALERCDVAVLMLDAEQGVTDQDAKIAGQIQLQKRAAVIVLNKWDRVSKDHKRNRELVGDVRQKLAFMDFASLVQTSAINGEGIPELFEQVKHAYEQFSREIQTADLNRVLEICTAQHPPPGAGGANSRVYYGTQIKTRPPTFRLFTNRLERVRGAYTRFLSHQLRYHFGLDGTPVEIIWKDKREDKAPPRPADRMARAKLKKGKPQGPSKLKPRTPRKRGPLAR